MSIYVYKIYVRTILTHIYIYIKLLNDFNTDSFDLPDLYHINHPAAPGVRLCQHHGWCPSL